MENLSFIFVVVTIEYPYHTLVRKSRTYVCSLPVEHVDRESGRIAKSEERSKKAYLYVPVRTWY